MVTLGKAVMREENGPFPSNETNLTAHTVLLNDNINKVPRDLEEVGPDQKQFRSSVKLYGRVTNTMVADATGYNEQYYARLAPTGKNAIDHTVTTIATALDLDMSYNQLSTMIVRTPVSLEMVIWFTIKLIQTL